MFSSSTTFSSATLLKRSRHDGTRRDSNTPARYSQSVQARFELETASLLLSNGQVIPPDATNNLSAAKPAAYRRTGDIGADVKSIGPLMEKMNIHPDLAKANGTYKAVEIGSKPNRPRVTIQRPYFDVTTSQVVDRTIILMSR